MDNPHPLYDYLHCPPEFAGLPLFLRESLQIEGIYRDPLPEEMYVSKNFLKQSKLTVASLTKLVHVFQQDAQLRNETGLDVYIGDHTPPRGGPLIEPMLQDLLNDINDKKIKSFEAHLEYEQLHPFTDGNGRSGRLVWLWQGVNQEKAKVPPSFLHMFYYQTLDESRNFVMPL